MEAEASGIAQRAEGSSVERRPKGLRGVLDHPQTPAPCEVRQFHDGRRNASVVDGDQGSACGTSAGLSASIGIETQGTLFDVCEHGAGADPEDSIRRRDESERGDDHVVPLADPKGEERQFQRVGAGCREENPSDPEALCQAPFDSPAEGTVPRRRGRRGTRGPAPSRARRTTGTKAGWAPSDSPWQTASSSPYASTRRPSRRHTVCVEGGGGHRSPNQPAD